MNFLICSDANKIERLYNLELVNEIEMDNLNYIITLYFYQRGAYKLEYADKNTFDIAVTNIKNFLSTKHPLVYA